MTGAAALGAVPLLAANSSPKDISISNRKTDDWHQVATGKKGIPNREKNLNFDVMVIGGGLAGISAAVSSARNGAKTILVQDRPVLGGNASSEMRVTVNGVQNLTNKHKVERETGIIEELLIENWVYNPQESYPVWDHVLYNYVKRETNITLMLNTQAIDVKMNSNTIKTAICWQGTTETKFYISAEQFVDCSGDGLLAAQAGAEYRTGREGRDEFDEKFAPIKADGWMMGECIMMITKDMGKPCPFKAPDYAIPFNAEAAFKDKHRRIKQLKEGFWWIEIGNDFDNIAVREEVSHKLMAYFYGVWDHIKNSGDFPEANNLALDWIGSIPGRRESRRFMGDYILTQKDMITYRHFNDAVAFGGWSLDEHNPGGIEDLSQPASYFHSRFNQVYEIPYRALYSKNINNLSFAGRNVSVTHMALSSSRIIGTCSMMGQAAGTAAALCTQKKVNPRQIANHHIKELQEQILRDDSYIPNRPANDSNNLATQAKLSASSTSSGHVDLLTDGVSRDTIESIHHWESEGTNASLLLSWPKPIKLSKVELKGNTNLQRKLMMHKNPAKNEGQINGVPPELVKDLVIEAKISDRWQKIATVRNNITRLVKTSFDTITTDEIRLTLNNTHGASNIRLYEIRCYS